MTLNVPASYLTVQAAVNAANSGDTIAVSPGNYPEDIVTKSAKPGITIVGSGAVLGTLRVNQPDWKLEGVTFEGLGKAQKFQALINVMAGAHRLSLNRVKVDAKSVLSVNGIAWSFDGAGPGPFPLTMASECVIQNCEVTGVKGHTALVLAGSRNIVRNCNFHDVIQSDFVRLFGENNRITDNVFDGNRLAFGETIGNHSDGLQVFGSLGYGSRNNLIDQNAFRNVEGQIMQLEQNEAGEAISGWEFRNNLFSDITLGCSVTHSKIKFYNNTFVRVWTTGGHVINLGNGPRGNSNGAEIFNNVFYDCGKPTTNEMGWFGDGTTDLVTYKPVQFTADYNYYGKGTDFKKARTDTSNPRFRWSDAHGINGGDPGFVDAANGDFRLRADSPLRGAGKDGADIGAFPYVEAAPKVVRVNFEESDDMENWRVIHTIESTEDRKFYRVSFAE